MPDGIRAKCGWITRNLLFYPSSDGSIASSSSFVYKPLAACTNASNGEPAQQVNINSDSRNTKSQWQFNESQWWGLLLLFNIKCCALSGGVMGSSNDIISHLNHNSSEKNVEAGSQWWGLILVALLQKKCWCLKWCNGLELWHQLEYYYHPRVSSIIVSMGCLMSTWGTATVSRRSVHRRRGESSIYAHITESAHSISPIILRVDWSSRYAEIEGLRGRASIFWSSRYYAEFEEWGQ